MKLILVAALLLAGCAQTRIYDQGRLVAVIQGDASNITIKSPDIYVHIDNLNNSAATAAAYGGATSLVGGIAAGVISGLLAKP